MGDVDPRNQFDTWLREDDDDKSPGTPNSERSFKSGLSVFSTDTPVMRPMVTDSLFDSESDSERAPWDSDYDDEDDDDEEDCDEGDYSVTAEEIPRPAYKAVTDSRLSLPSWRPALPLSLSEVPDALSSFIIESSAEMGSRVKQTPIPNALSYLASHVLSLAYTLDDKLDIYDKSVQLLESLIRVWIWICTVSVTAGIRFFVAYQTTPPSPKPMPQRIVPVEQLRRRPSKGKGKLEPADASYASKSVSNGMIASVVGPVASSLLGWVPTLSLLNSTLPSSRTAPCSTSQDEPSLPPGTIQLSVGGFPFATTSQTLQSASGSYFSRLVSDQTTSRRRSPDNQIVFIDRDGTHFRHILNHLRGILRLITHGLYI